MRLTRTHRTYKTYRTVLSVLWVLFVLSRHSIGHLFLSCAMEHDEKPLLWHPTAPLFLQGANMRAPGPLPISPL